jgi:WD40 repeat protein
MFNVLQERRPKFPSNEVPIPRKIWQLVQLCWTHHPNQRPVMDAVARKLESVKPRPLPTILQGLLGGWLSLVGWLCPFKERSSICCIVIASDCSLIASASFDGIIRVWDAETTQSRQLEHNDSRRIAFSSDGKYLASRALGDSPIRIWDLETGACRKLTTTGHDLLVHAIAFSPDGNHVASDHGPTICIWDVNSGTSKILWGEPGRGWAIAFSPDGKQIASNTSSMIHIWDVETGLSRSSVEHGSWIHCIAWSPNGTSIAYGSSDKAVHLWNVQTDTFQIFMGHRGPVSCVAFSSDSEEIVSGSWDRSVCVWDTMTCAIISGPFIGHHGKVLCVTFSLDGRYVVSASGEDTAIKAWTV